jgi:hypothetical protein
MTAFSLYAPENKQVHDFRVKYWYLVSLELFLNLCLGEVLYSRFDLSHNIRRHNADTRVNLLITKLSPSSFCFQSGNFKYSVQHSHLNTLNPNKILSIWRWHGTACRHEAILSDFGLRNKSQYIGNGFCFLIQVDNILWRVDLSLGNAHKTHAVNSRGAVFSVVRARTVAMQRTLGTLSLTRWRHTTMERLCFLLWSMPGDCKEQQKRRFLLGRRHVQC